MAKPLTGSVCYAYTRSNLWVHGLFMRLTSYFIAIFFLITVFSVKANENTTCQRCGKIYCISQMSKENCRKLQKLLDGVLQLQSLQQMYLYSPHLAQQEIQQTPSEAHQRLLQLGSLILELQNSEEQINDFCQCMIHTVYIPQAD